ncbi:hypothetical protein TIFTF001_054904 [Ficus carica]|uniref:Uncharacterized protein n=1 Tax=Ficus carica TaxID=3494 RepID=A0AA88ENB2_FICCA|nr:hypothetical protein TIFTF001_054904 [Ficus carica]
MQFGRQDHLVTLGGFGFEDGGSKRRSCTYLSHCVPLEAALLLGTAAGLVLLE